jgi:hypothetical protein
LQAVDQDSQRKGSLRRRDGVAERLQPVSVLSSSRSVHPSGNPINRSTKPGLRTSPPRPSFDVPGPWWPRIWSVSDSPACITPVVVVPRADAEASRVFGVAQKEQSLAPVWSPDIGRSCSRPFRIVPARGKIA